MMGENASRTIDDGWDHQALNGKLVGRRKFRDAVASAAATACADAPRSLFFVQIERLFEVRRQCGPGAEQALLEVVQRRLAAEIAPWRAECRTGRDRFAILKEGCGRVLAGVLAHRICDVLDRETFSWGTATFRLAATVGVLELEERPARLDDLLERAAEACATARSLGNDGVVMLTGRPGELESLARDQSWREHLNDVLG